MEKATRYRLRLYIIAGRTYAKISVENLKSICQTVLAGRHELEIIDVSEKTALADEDRVLATPTLLRLEPKPIRRIVGDLSDRARVMQALEIDQ